VFRSLRAAPISGRDCEGRVNALKTTSPAYADLERRLERLGLSGTERFVRDRGNDFRLAFADDDLAATSRRNG
jgi:hypothetical protein